MLRLELADVVPQLLREIAFRLSLLDVRAADARDIAVLEHCRHRLDSPEEIGDWLEVLVLENARLFCSSVGIVGNGIPRAEHDVLEVGERNKLANERRPFFRSLPKADRRHLRQRTD